jgi:hypothetical protein
MTLYGIHLQIRSNFLFLILISFVFTSVLLKVISVVISLMISAFAPYVNKCVVNFK